MSHISIYINVTNGDNILAEYEEESTKHAGNIDLVRFLLSDLHTEK